MGDEKEKKKPTSYPKTRVCKDMMRKGARTRENFEARCRLKMPYFIVPCISCCCVSIKLAAIIFIFEPILMVTVFFSAIISFVLRLFCCPHGGDCYFSAMECILLLDDLIGLYWESTYWREWERKEDGDKEKENSEEKDSVEEAV